MDKNKKIKLEHLANIVAVATADGIMTKDELAFLYERAQEYGIDKNDVKNLINNAEKLKFVIPMNQEEREEQLSEAVMMSMIDGKIDQKEYELCLKLAEKLDLNKTYLDHVISLTKKLWKYD